jgi:hypothetical protein
MKILLRFGCGLAAALLLVAAGCGGGTSTIPHFDGNDNNGVNGNITGGGGNGSTPDGSTQPPLARLMESQPIVGATANAPLGLDPKYQVEEVLPQGQAVSSISHAGSLLAGGDYLSLVAVTVAPEGETPDFTPEPGSLEFDEGDQVTLWAQFDTNSPSAFDADFSIPQLEYSFDTTLTPVSEGVQNFSMDYLIPYVPGHETTTCEFILTAADADGSPKSVSFVVNDVPSVPLPTQTWQMAWETQLVQSDYDYNDLVVRMDATEHQDTSTGKIIEIDLIIKAIARGEGYSADWEFNLADDFPGTDTVTSTTQLFKAGGATPDGPIRTWRSKQGICIPVFTPVKNVLPSPPGGGSVVNVLPGQDYYAGGLAKIKIIPTPPMDPGVYVPLPYTNQMLILDRDDTSQVYVISLRTNRGGNKSGDDPHPLGFILPPDSPAYNWPLEGMDIDNSYEQYLDWMNWWNLSAGGTSHYQDGTVMHYSDPEPRWWLHIPQTDPTDDGFVYWDINSVNLVGAPTPPLPIPQ